MSILDTLRNMMSPEQRSVIGEEARQLLENKHFREAFDAVDGYLNEVALSCDPDNKEKAQRVILSKQLLASIKQEIIRKVEDGEVARVQIAELDKRARVRVFQR